MDAELFELTRELHFLDVRLRLTLNDHPRNDELRHELEDRRAAAAARLAQAQAERGWRADVARRYTS
jgi:hypothetical protein